MDIKDFDLSSSSSVGGLTGSVRVKSGDSYYQLKPSILDNSFIRKTKARGVDRENFGEVIASHICGSIFNSKDFSSVPKVNLVYDEENGRVLIASKYLIGKKVRTLDDYGSQKSSLKSRHVKVVRDVSEGDDLDISKESSIFRRDLARSLVASMLVGDHDVNPGNMMVVQQDNGTERVARIDFGHAFNDLLNAPRLLGGRVDSNYNRIIDFINREKVAGIPANKSKLWRDYPGLIPSQELADALSESAKTLGLQGGINDAKGEFLSLYFLLKNKGQQGVIDHVQNSLVAIANNIRHPIKLDIKDKSFEQIADEVFLVIGGFCKTNQEMMIDAARIMQIQVDIDKYLHSPASYPRLLDEIVTQYNDLKTLPGFSTESEGIRWLKTSEKKKAYEGNLQEYFSWRAAHLGKTAPNLKHISEYNDSVYPKTVRKVLNNPKLYLVSVAVCTGIGIVVGSILSFGILPAAVLPIATAITLMSGGLGSIIGYKFASSSKHKNFLSSGKSESHIADRFTEDPIKKEQPKKHIKRIRKRKKRKQRNKTFVSKLQSAREEAKKELTK